MKRATKYRLTLIALLLTATTATAQIKIGQDTIECHIIGFRVGTMVPSASLSKATLAANATHQASTMADLYKAPWLNFGMSGHYKYKTNWVMTMDLDLWFGEDNLKHRQERMPHVYSNDATPIVIGNNGTDAGVTSFNRGLSAQIGIGRMMRVIPNNPNSGIMLRAAAGAMQQQTIFMINEVEAPQIDGDYALLYDHQRRGLMLTEGIGLWFMSNKENLVNFHIEFTLTQCWSHSTRNYTIDHLLQMAGKDQSRYLDLIYGLRLTWMFPLKGKTAYDYYFY